MEKETIFVDLDNTALDYDGHFQIYKKLYPNTNHPQSVIGFFQSMKPMEDFIESWNILSEHYDMRFLTRPSLDNLNSYTEKAIWVRDNIGGKEALEKLNLCPDKSIVKGAFLIDDWTGNGQTEFEGMHIHFGHDERFMNWKMVTKFLLDRLK